MFQRRGIRKKDSVFIQVLNGKRNEIILALTALGRIEN
jgi:hypothetical protein